MSRSLEQPLERVLALPQPGEIRKHDEGLSNSVVVDTSIFLLPISDYKAMALMTAVAAAVRLFNIHQPSSVVFDEVHFGRFTSKYIHGRFFIDIDPPLAKLLIALAGSLAGFDGEFDFEIGKDYIVPQIPYIAMRLVPAVCGILLVPIMFLTLKAAGCKTITAVLGAGLIICENGLLTQARLILPDAPLVTMTAFTTLAFTSFVNQCEQGPSKAFQAIWWFWLFMTGLGLGATASIKWEGLYSIAWVWSLTVVQLWILLSNVKTATPRKFIQHLAARIVCLLIIPAAFYLAIFAIHFMYLVNTGDGDGFMSSEFQATLKSKDVQDVPVNVALGSRVTIKHVNTYGGYLHSHNLTYLTGSKQQQITLYPYQDESNTWLIENMTQPLDMEGYSINSTSLWDMLSPPTFIRNGDIIKLYHIKTDRRLHSHDFRAPLSVANWQNEVSAYGYIGFQGDANDYFRVEIVKEMSDGEDAKVYMRTIQTKFKLVHVLTGCTLFSHNVKLPQWALGQQEVTCAKGGILHNSLWYVEQNKHPLLRDAEKIIYRDPGFLKKFWELQKVMWNADPNMIESNSWDSHPLSWPILRRGVNFWTKDHRQIYLTGNPIVWWSSTLATITYIAFKALLILRWQRGFRDYENTILKRFDYEIGTYVLGWAFHYFPFYFMQRPLFLYNYFPALYFSIITICEIYDYITARISCSGHHKRQLIGRMGTVIFLALSMIAFGVYSPLAYGRPWTQSTCNRAKLFRTWDWDCDNIHAPHPQFFTEHVSKTIQRTDSLSILHQDPTTIARDEQEPFVQQNQYISEAPTFIPGLPVRPVYRLVSHGGKVELRDQYGNLPNQDEINALEGRVGFKTV